MMSLLLLAALAGHGSAGASRYLMPTVYEAGHVYVDGTLRGGGHLKLLVDSGGAGGSGWYVVDAAAVRRLGLATASCTLGEAHLNVIRSVPFVPGKGWPASRHTPCDSAALVSTSIGRGTGVDGTLGAGYLPGHVWTFDYPGQRLWREAADWKPRSDAHRTTLGHVRNGHGWATGFPRLRIRVDGRPLDLLLDTGATGKPTAAGKRASHEPTTAQGIGVTSYIVSSVLERWHREHPDWRVVADGDDLFGPGHATRMIEVPEVDVAGWRVGPVWFTERADVNFHQGISQYTDRRVDGSAGANLFRHFVMTLDYPHGAAWFRCMRGCRPVPSHASASSVKASGGGRKS